MLQRFPVLVLSLCLASECFGAVVNAQSALEDKPVAAKPAPKKAAGPTCKLEEEEIPRGGRLDVSGTGFGQTPVVRIAGKPARMLERREDRISVQVAADSNGGAVTVQIGDTTVPCGTLVITGKNRED